MAWRLLARPGYAHPVALPTLVRFIVPAAFIAVFLALATVALDKPGYYYDEVIFVPASLRVLGQCDVDAAVTREIGCLPLMQTLGYVGAVKAWLHAPLFATFGINVWTVRLPSILLAAATLVLLWLFVRHELGSAWALLLLALTATDPVLVSHARLDWGPAVIAAFAPRVVADRVMAMDPDGTHVLACNGVRRPADRLFRQAQFPVGDHRAGRCGRARRSARTARAPAQRRPMAAGDRRRDRRRAAVGRGDAGAKRGAARHAGRRGDDSASWRNCARCGTSTRRPSAVRR